MQKQVKKGFISIRFKIICSSFLLITVLIALIGIFSYSVTRNILKGKLIENNLNDLKVIKNAMENAFIEVEKTAYILISDESIREQFDYFYNSEPSQITEYNTKRRISSLVESIMEYQDEIYSLIIYTPAVTILWNNGDSNIDYLNANDEKMLSCPEGFILREHDNDLPGKGYADVLYIRGFELDATDTHCMVIAAVNHREILKSMSVDNFYISDKNNKIVWSDNKSLIGQVLSYDIILQSTQRESPYYLLNFFPKKDICLLEFEKMNWSLIYRTDKHHLQETLKPMALILGIFICFSSIFSIIASWILSNKIVRNIEFISKKVANFSGKDTGMNKKGNKNKSSPFGLSYYKKLLLYHMMIMIIPSIVFIGILAKVSSDIVLSNVTQSYISNGEKIAKNIGLYFENENRLSKYLLFNDTIQSIMKKSNSSAAEKREIEDIEAFTHILHKWAIYHYNNYDITLYDKEGEFLFSSLLYKERVNLKELVEPGFIELFDEPESKISFLNVMKTDFNHFQIPLLRRIKDINNPFGKESQLGFILLNIEEKDIRSRYENVNFGNEGRVYLLNNEDIIVSSLDKTSIGNCLPLVMEKESFQYIDSQSYFVIRTPVLDYGMLVMEISYKEMLSQSNYMILYNILILLIGIAIAVLLSLLISRSMSKPLIILKNATMKVAEGDFKTRIEFDTNDEFQILIHSFNDMVKRIHDLIEQVYEAQIKENTLTVKQKEAELYALQAQINPHFLFNTLGAVSASIKLKEMDDAIEMINALAKLFRINISKEELLIPVIEEIEHVRAYLRIQKLRLENKFEYDMKIDPGIFKFKTIKLILQPVVENSIIHGIKMKEEKVSIWLKGEIKRERVVFTVQDNGRGMGKEQLEALKEKIFHDDNSKAVGLKNIYSRLNAYFSTNFEFTILSSEHEGTTVVIGIPVIR